MYLSDNMNNQEHIMTTKREGPEREEIMQIIAFGI